MKKLFSKIAVVSVGAAMAIGLAIAARQNNAVAAHAEEVTINADNSGWTTTAGAQAGTAVNGITVSSTNGLVGTADDIKAMRNYSGADLTVTSTVGNMTSVAFECTANNASNYGPGKMSLKSGSAGAYAYENKIGTWTGNADTFTLTGGQSRIKTITVTYSAGGATVTSVGNVTGEMKKTYTTVESWDKSNLSAAVTMSDESTYSGTITYNFTPASPAEMGAKENGSVSVTATAGGKTSAEATTFNEINVSLATVAQGIAATPASGNSELVSVKGKISRLSTMSDGVYSYYISDDGTEANELYVYKGKNVGNVNFTSATELSVGDDVVVYGRLTTYNSNPQFGGGNYLKSRESNTPAVTIKNHVDGLNVGETSTFTAEKVNAGDNNIVWSSSDANVATVDPSTGLVTAVAAGKVDIKATITVNTVEYTDKVQLSVFKDAVKVGDEIRISATKSDKKYYLKDLDSTNKLGTCTQTEADAMVLTVEEGAEANTFALKSGDNYLKANTSNQLVSETTKSADSSWTIITNNTDYLVKNVGQNTRTLQYNHNSDTGDNTKNRFACYTSTQTAIAVEVITHEPAIKISADKTSLEKDQVANLTVSLLNGATGNATITTEDTEFINLVDNHDNTATATALKAGTAVVKANLEGCAEVQLTLTITEPAQIETLTHAQALALIKALAIPAGEKDSTYVGGSSLEEATLYNVEGYISSKDAWYENGNTKNGTFYITATADSTDDPISVFRMTDKAVFDEATIGSKVSVQGKLALFGSVKQTPEIVNPVVTILEKAEVVPTEVNVAGALAALSAGEEPAAGKTTTLQGVYAVTGFVTSESYWDSKNNRGLLFIADDVEAPKAEQVEVFSISVRADFDALNVVGMQVKATGSLAWYKNSSGVSTFEITGPTVVKLADPSYEVEDLNVAQALAKIAAIENPGAYDNFVASGKNFKVTGYVVKVEKFYSGEGEDAQFTNGNIRLADARGAELDNSILVYGIAEETTLDACEVDAKVEVVGRLNNRGNKDATSFTSQVSNYVSVTVKEAAPDKIESIEVKTNPTKVEYTVGETFDSTGLVIKVNHTKQAAEELTEGFTLSAPDMTTEGRKAVTVTYEGQTASFMITVNPLPVTLESITLAGPTKTEYNIGETLDTTGLVVTAHFSDESSEVVASGYTLSEVDLSTAGAKEVTVTYEGKTAKFNITVVDPIAVAKEAARTELNNYATAKGQTNYSAKNWTELQGYLSQGLEALGAENCNTIEKINRVINATKSLVDGVKTAAQEAADALANAKTEAKDELTTYFNGKDATKYSQENNAKLADELTKGKAAIDAATSIDAVNTALTNAKAAMDAIPQIQPSSGGCGGSIAATSILLSTLALAGVGLLMLKRRKED